MQIYFILFGRVALGFLDETETAESVTKLASDVGAFGISGGATGGDDDNEAGFQLILVLDRTKPLPEYPADTAAHHSAADPLGDRESHAVEIFFFGVGDHKSLCRLVAENVDGGELARRALTARISLAEKVIFGQR